MSKQIERRIPAITYRWWRSDGKTIKKSHVEALEESANARIKEMRAEGYTSGELCDSVRMTARDGEDGIQYDGYWELK